MSGVERLTQDIMLVQKEKGETVGEWLREQEFVSSSAMCTAQAMRP